MRRFFSGFILLTFFSTVALATLKGTPFQPEVDSRFNTIESMAGDVTLSDGTSAIGAGKVTEAMQYAITADGLHSQRVARATLNCAASGCSVGAHSLGVTLPAKALITRSYIYVVTQFADTGTCTVAIHCEDANNIKTATDITGSAAGAFIEGQSTGAASAFVGSIASACAITATVADGGSCVPTAGKGIVFVEYVVGE